MKRSPQKVIIVANWKMNPKTLEKAQALIKSYEVGIMKYGKPASVWAAVPHAYLEHLKSKKVKLGVQDIYAGQARAMTGEIPVRMAKNLGARFTILGHSERKKLGETRVMVREKLASALKNGLIVVLCFGEDKPTTNNKQLITYLKKQLLYFLRALPILHSTFYILRSRLILAYEPAWAISTNQSQKSKVKSPSFAKASEGRQNLKRQAERARKITGELSAWTEKKFKKKFIFIYGGSVNSKNIAEFVQPPFCGALVGAASLDPKEFGKVVKIAARQSAL